jgi:hypothetical protein
MGVCGLHRRNPGRRRAARPDRPTRAYLGRGGSSGSQRGGSLRACTARRENIRGDRAARVCKHAPTGSPLSDGGCRGGPHPRRAMRSITPSRPSNGKRPGSTA